MVHAVQSRHFVDQIDAHEPETTQNPNESGAVGGGPGYTRDAADDLLGNDVSAASGNSAVYEAAAGLLRMRRCRVGGSVKRGGYHLLVNFGNKLGVGEESDADGACRCAL